MIDKEQTQSDDEAHELGVLIVDDDWDFAESLEDILSDRGYRTAIAHDPESALQKVGEFEMLVALVDVRLGKSSGIDLISKLKAAREEIMCVVMTAYAATENAIQALKHGAYDYLRKPVGAEELFVTLDRCFDRIRLDWEKKRAEHNLRARTRELEQVISQLKRIVVSCREIANFSRWSELGKLLLEEFSKNLATRGGSLFLREGDRLKLEHSLDFEEHTPPFIDFPLPETAILARVWSTKEPVFIPNVELESSVTPSGWEGYTDASTLAFPLIDSNGEITGIITMHNKLSPPFTQQDREIGAILASFGSETLRATRAIEALSNSEKKYRTLLSNIEEGYLELDTEGRVIFANDVMIKILGFDRHDLGGHNITRFTDAATTLRLDEALRSVIETGKPVLMMDFRVVRDDGSLRDLELSTSLVVDRTGKPSGFRALARDVTDRRRAEKERQRLATAVEHTAEGIIIADMEGTIEYVNPAFEQLSCYKREELIGSTFPAIQKHKDGGDLLESICHSVFQGEVWSGRTIIQRKDGVLREFISTVSPINNELNQTTGLVSVNRDVTYEVELQRQLREAQKMEAIGTLAGGMAHDFNNLLQAILGYSELLLFNKAKGDPGFKELSEVMGAAKRGSELTRRLLTFSRKIESSKRPIDMNHEVTRVASILTRTIPKMIEIEWDLSPDLKLINADPVQLEQVLMNLAVNARDAMPEGGKFGIQTRPVTLSADYCKLHPGAKPGEHVVLKVNDTGQGMDKETQEHIFEPFFTTKTMGRGTGLGLAMVYGIIKNHDGYIVCQSSPGAGTQFEIYLPTIDQPGSIQATEAADPVQGGNETILLVDDEDYLRMYGKKFLEFFGYKVLTAADGETALELYQSEGDHITLIILDYMMPGMGGKQCLKKLLAANPRAKVLMTSGYAPQGTQAEALQTGAGGFIAKPYEANQLLALIRKMIDGQDNSHT